jgi:hypothetical protein
MQAFLELRSAENLATAIRAFYVAESGLNRSLASAIDTSALSKSSYPVAGGEAWVVSRRLLEPHPAWQLRFITSEGRVDPRREGPAKRTVAQLVLAPRPFRAPAAVLSTGPAFLGGTSRISGLAVGSADCSGPASVAGLALPPGAFEGDTAQLAGSPPLRLEPAIDAMILASGLDWRNARRPEFLEPEWIVTAGWPEAPLAGPADWPAIFIPAPSPPFTGTVAGRGVLVVDGDLAVDGELRWEGLVVVAGRAFVTGTLAVRGAVLLGLEGPPAGPTAGSSLSGRVDVRFDACAVAGAAARLTRGPIRYPGGWYELY